MLLAACPPPPKAGPVFPPQTTLRLAASVRCHGASCRCRALDTNDGQGEERIPTGHKRFELRLGRTPSALWVAIEGQGVFYKPPENVLPVCFYLDLPPGQQQVTVRGEKRDPEVGLQVGLVISEHGKKEAPVWYRSLDFVCGSAASRCTKQGMESWIAEQRKLPRGVLDPCGSTMIRGVSFGGVREERLEGEYRDLDLRLRLKIYAFETKLPPGSPECRAPVKNRPADSSAEED